MADEPKAPRVNGTALAKMCEERLNSLKNARMLFEPIWDDISRYVMPGDANTIYRIRSEPNVDAEAALFDSTAVYSNMVLANGMLANMTPADASWFSFDPPERIKTSDKAQAWFQKCTEIARMELAKSNFYSEYHENLFQSGSYGTDVIVALPGKSAALNFKSVNLGQFWIAEDDEGIVDTLFRELPLTCRQAEQKFGRDSLSPKMIKALECFEKDGKEGGEFMIYHGIYPRMYADREHKKADGENKPWASVYWVGGERHLLAEEGFDEKPFFASRYKRCFQSCYGQAPGWVALPDARQLNFLSKQLDALAEVSAFPRFLAPDSMVGEIDLRSGGMTVFDPGQPNAVPKEWMTGGRYDIGLDRENRKQKSIERAFHVDLFQMFANIDKQMTAREVSERSAEKLAQFTPAFARKTTEQITPLLRRVFGILIRAGHFPEPPEDVLIRGDGGAFIPDPEIIYSSRIALAIKAQQNAAFYRSMEIIGPIAQTNPDIMDNFDFDVISRETSRNDGLPSDWMRDIEARDKMREDRAAAMAEQAQQQQALAASQAAKNLGGVPAGSVAGQAMAGAVGA